MKRLIGPLSVFLLVALVGCSSTAASSPPETASQGLGSTAPGESPTSAPVAGGTATDFCSAFMELEAIDSNGADMASAGRQFQAAAADMRKYAPAEIQQAANTYADLMDTIGKAAADGSFDEAALQQAMSDATAESAKDIGTTAVWVSKNCDL